MTVRKMINTPQSTVKRISDCAYSRITLPIGHRIDAAAVEAERRELALHDWNCAPSALVEASLIKGGVSRDKLISTSFGWSPARSAREVEKRHNWEVASYA
ncbi:hypothetical protein ABIB57_002949 [Devosia sp. UYZn731]|uniref:hypothetical protein n=1 Tax=Devosia sp. UYZn731 TaxID=3156345 RepID=UPI003394980D